MDNIIHFSFVTLDSIPGHDRKPSAFKDKAKYLVKVFNHNKELALHKAKASALIERARAFSITRHAFTHGALESLEDTVLTINKLQTKSEYCVDLVKIDIMDFPAHAQEIGGLVTEWTLLSKMLFDEHQKRKQLLAQ